LLAVNNAWAVGFTVTKLSNNIYNNKRPVIHDGQAAWLGGNRIYFYDGIQSIMLPGGSSTFGLKIHNGQAAWKGSVNSPPLTNNSGHDVGPIVENNNIVWQQFDGNDYEIIFYNGGSTTQLTNNGYFDGNADIHNGQIVWQGYDGNDYVM